jgi:hypothetical protein
MAYSEAKLNRKSEKSKGKGEMEYDILYYKKEKYILLHSSMALQPFVGP